MKAHHQRATNYLYISLLNTEHYINTWLSPISFPSQVQSISVHKQQTSFFKSQLEERMAKESTTIDVGEPSTITKSSSHVVVDEKKKKKGFVAAAAGGGYKRGLAIFDFLLRLAAIGITIGASSVMFTAEETLPFFTQFLQFQAGYDDFPTFQ